MEDNDAGTPAKPNITVKKMRKKILRNQEQLDELELQQLMVQQKLDRKKVKFEIEKQEAYLNSQDSEG